MLSVALFFIVMQTNVRLNVVVLSVAAPFLLCSCPKNAFQAFIFSWKCLKKNYFPTFGVFLQFIFCFLVAETGNAK